MTTEEMKKNIVTAIVTLVIVTLGGFLIKDWFTVPKAYIRVDNDCNENLLINENTRFSPLIKNLGDSPALVQKCISSDEFLIGQNLDHYNVCSNWIDLHHQTAETKWALPGDWDVIPDKNIVDKINNATITVQINCKQKIWFLDRECSPVVYSCRYNKTDNKFNLIKD